MLPDAIPPEFKTRLRHQFHGNAGANLRLAHALTAMLQAFGVAAIPVIPFKGSILANFTYGKLSLRQYYDVDLLIRHQDVGTCERVLAAHGYVRDEAFDREARYRRPDTGAEVDVHWGFTPRFFHLPSTSTRSTHGPARGPAGPAGDDVCPEDLLEILCVQVLKDCWERRQQLEHLSKVCDISEHLRAHPQMAWSRVFKSAQDKGLERIIHCALILARELLQAGLPSEVVKRIEADRRARKCAWRMCRSLFTPTDTLSPLTNPYLSIGLRLRQLAFYMSIRERFRERLRHVGEILKSPGSHGSGHAVGVDHSRL